MQAASARIDGVTAEGCINGWAVGPHPRLPCQVGVVLNEALVGRAEARQFRADVLAAGIGHGHYGFAARLPASVEAGTHSLRLIDPDRTLLAEAVLDVPPRAPPARLSVEALLSAGPRWSEQALLERLDCLELARHRALMGDRRFVDAGFRYVLDRPVDALSETYYLAALERGAVTPDSFLAGLLRSPDRKAVTTPLASPYEAKFPWFGLE